ncbi:MAG TPA: FG-GAP-like repeat-containing protein [Candidatus Eisenbacteria bacterium]|jgi:hypothetical protein
MNTLFKLTSSLVLLTLLALGGAATPTEAAVPAPGPGPSFDAPFPLLPGAGSTMAVQADFDLDGRMDIAVTNQVAGTVSILFGPTFSTVLSFPVVSGNSLAQPVYLAVGDFNKDGKPDLVVVNRQDNSATVFKNTLTGSTLTFTTSRIPIPLPAGATGSQPAQVAVADVDGDGNLDFATANYLSNTIAVFFGDGTGITFLAHPTKLYSLSGAVSGTNPNSIVFTDLNRDGKPDVVVGANNGSQLFVLVNTGSATDPYVANGTFANPMPYTIGANPVAAAAADMNGDLSPDVVVSNNGGVNGTPVISILFGNGDGFLGTAPCLQGGCGAGRRLDIPGVGASPQGVVVGDMNGDSYPDFAVVDDSHGTGDGLRIFLGNGLGCFGNTAPVGSPCGTWAPTNWVPGTLPRGVGLGDMNGDGRPDLYVANTVAPGLTLFTNNLPGAAACAAAVTPPTCITTRTPCLGMDVNISNVVPGGAAVRGYSLTLRLSTNLALCLPPSPIGPLPAAAFVKGDFLPGLLGTRNTEQHITLNADGSYTVDEVILDPPTPGPASCGPTSGAGKLFTVFVAAASPAITRATGTVSITGLVLRDCNNGPLTAFACPTFSQGTVTIKRIDPLAATALRERQNKSGNNPTGSPTPPAAQTTAITVSWTPPPNDTDSPPATTRVDVWRAPFVAGTSGACSLVNGYPDYQGQVPTAPSLTTLYPATSVLTFGARTDVTAASPPVAVAIGDLNGDCRSDLVTANSATSNNISVFLGASTPGLFSPKQDFTVNGTPNAVAIGDVDGDGRPDIVTTNVGATNNVSILRGTGTVGLFNPKQDFTVAGSPVAIAIGDFNGDARLDLVTVNNGTTNNVSVLLATGTPSLFAPKQDFTAGANPIAVALGDINNDGRLDVVTANNSATNNISVLLGTTPTGLFAPKQDFTVAANPRAIAIADLDLDGKLDVVTVNGGGTSNVSLLPGTGTVGLFAARQDFTVASGPLAVAIGDMNGDSRPDVVTANNGAAGNVSVLLGAGASPVFTTGHVDFTAAGNPLGVAIGDVNGDGRLDVGTMNGGVTTNVSVLPGGSGTTAPWVRVKTIPPAAINQPFSFIDQSFPLLGPGPLKQRGYWYYLVVRVDECGTPSALLGPSSDALSLDSGTLNYHLGDVARPDGATCSGDNEVTAADLLAFVTAWNLPIPLGQADPQGRNCWDFGPSVSGTANPGSVDQRPSRDGVINREELVLWALNFKQVSAPQFAALPLAGDHDELTLEAPARVRKDETFAVKLRLKGAGDLHGIFAFLNWDQSIAQILAVESDELARSQNAIVLSEAGGIVDAAVPGSDRPGFAGEGVLATVTFRALSDGQPRVAIGKIDARDRTNSRVFVSGGQQVAPAATGLAPVLPNPFTRTAELRFSLAVGGRVDLTIYSVDGRRVRSLAAGSRPAGEYRLGWDGTDESGRRVQPGLFFARLVTPQGRFNRTLVMIR